MSRATRQEPLYTIIPVKDCFSVKIERTPSTKQVNSRGVVEGAELDSSHNMKAL